MSFQAMTWAVEQKVPALQKLVLLMLANRSNHDTGICIPSHKRIAEDCGMSVSSVKRAITQLADAGLLSIEERSVQGVSLPNQYVLALGRPGSVGTDPSSHRPDGVGSVGATKQETSKPGSKPSPSGGRASRLPGDWALPEEWRAWATSETGWPTDRIERVAEKFRDYWVARGGSAGRKLDWLATWRNWIRTEFDRSRGAAPRAGNMHNRIDGGQRSTAEIEAEAEQLGFRTMGAP